MPDRAKKPFKQPPPTLEEIILTGVAFALLIGLWVGGWIIHV